MNIETYIMSSLENIGNTNFDGLIKFIALIFVIFWLIVVYWVYSDIRERTKSKAMQLLSVFIVLLLNIIGLIVYLLLRPRYTIDEIYWADLERKYLRQEVAGISSCSVCGFDNLPNYLACPSCGNELRKKCKDCGSFNELEWKCCPYCGTCDETVRITQTAEMNSTITPLTSPDVVSTKQKNASNPLLKLKDLTPAFKNLFKFEKKVKAEASEVAAENSAHSVTKNVELVKSNKSKSKSKSKKKKK
jgi:hypothetical protein